MTASCVTPARWDAVCSLRITRDPEAREGHRALCAMWMSLALRLPLAESGAGRCLRRFAGARPQDLACRRRCLAASLLATCHRLPSSFLNFGAPHAFALPIDPSTKHQQSRRLSTKDGCTDLAKGGVEC